MLTTFSHRLSNCRSVVQTELYATYYYTVCFIFRFSAWKQKIISEEGTYVYRNSTIFAIAKQELYSEVCTFLTMKFPKFFLSEI